MRNALIASAVVGMTLLSGCSATTSTTRASFATIPASDAPTGSSINQETFTGTGPKTEHVVSLKGSKAWIYISCFSQEKGDPLPEAKYGGVQVSVGSNGLGGAGCGNDHDKGNPLIIINVPLKGAMTGPININTAKNTRWQVTVASGS